MFKCLTFLSIIFVLYFCFRKFNFFKKIVIYLMETATLINIILEVYFVKKMSIPEKLLEKRIENNRVENSCLRLYILVVIGEMRFVTSPAEGRSKLSIWGKSLY